MNIPYILYIHTIIRKVPVFDLIDKISNTCPTINHRSEFQCIKSFESRKVLK